MIAGIDTHKDTLAVAVVDDAGSNTPSQGLIQPPQQAPRVDNVQD